MSELSLPDNTLIVYLKTIDDKTMYHAKTRDNPAITVDYFPPIGTGNGYTSLELFMMSFGSCISTTFITLLRYRMKKQVDGISAEVKGIVRKEHPKSLKKMVLFLKIKAKDLSKAEVKEALSVAENGLCPVWAMIRGNVDVDIEFEIVN